MHMSQPISFRPGQPQSFIATRSFDLGTSGLKIHAEQEVLFDGTQVNVDGHHPITLPNLRGAIRMGWLVLADDFDPDQEEARPVSAGVQVRPAEGGNPMAPKDKITISTASVESEEREVTNVRAHADATVARNKAPRKRAASVSDAHGQDGVEVRRLMTPASQKTNVHTELGDAEKALSTVKVKAGVGRTREEVLAAMSDEDREAYLNEIASRASQYVEPEVVSTLKPSKRKSSTEGINSTLSVGGGVGIADLSGDGAPAQITRASSEGISFVNTNGPGTVKKKGALASTSAAGDSQSRQIARSICPDFPDSYNFTDPVRKKIARLQADFEDRPDVIRAVAAADTDPTVRQQLLQEFPEAFGG